MDPPSECYHLFPRLSHLPAFSLEAFPFTDEELDAAGLLGEGEPLFILCVYPTLTISLVGVSESTVQVMKTMREHPELLSESLGFFPCLYYIYQFAFRSISVHARVHQLHVPFLTRPVNP